MINANSIIKKTLFAEANYKDRCVKDYKELKDFIEHCRGIGLKIVLTQGSWDLVHVGHGRYLEAARKLGDLLIVGVDSDEKIKARKGPDRPIVPQDERMEMLTHLKSVDLVVLKELGAPKWSLIKTVKPDILIVIPENYTKKEIKELKKYCGEVVVLPRMATTSTSAKIRLMQIKMAERFEQSLTPRLIGMIQEVLGTSNKK